MHRRRLQTLLLSACILICINTEEARSQADTPPPATQGKRARMPLRDDVIIAGPALPPASDFKASSPLDSAPLPATKPLHVR